MEDNQKISLQKRIYSNKIAKGFNVTDIKKEIDEIRNELKELQSAFESGDTGHMPEEIADIVIFCYGLSEIIGADLDSEVLRKVAINEKREYIFVNGQRVRIKEADI